MSAILFHLGSMKTFLSQRVTRKDCKELLLVILRISRVPGNRMPLGRLLSSLSA